MRLPAPRRFRNREDAGAEAVVVEEAAQHDRARTVRNGELDFRELERVGARVLDDEIEVQRLAVSALDVRDVRGDANRDLRGVAQVPVKAASISALGRSAR